ncbi:MAG TPA: CAP domain-containing protein [Solirubrobacteraceae bacterium]|nr:CAP domain-containing protein [Solirubrobacteraceae bacterium]
MPLVASAASTLRPAPRVRVAGLLVLAALIAPLSSAPAALASAPRHRCRGAHVPVNRARPGEMRRAVLCLVNRERRRHGLPRLVASARLDRSAQRWTNAMVHSDQFTHGSAFMNRISATGFDWSTVGENIATGFRTPAAVVRAWMRSPGHCANILDPAYREVGTGLSARRIPHASSLVGTWTQDFGRLMGQRALSTDDGPARACYRR